jgi:hypothetical protein
LSRARRLATRAKKDTTRDPAPRNPDTGPEWMRNIAKEKFASKMVSYHEK